MKWVKKLSWLGYFLWAVFVNAVNEWIVRPLLLDYAALGLIGLVVIVLLWIFSIPKHLRRRWIGFTLFSLLFGMGAGGVLSKIHVASIVGLIIIALGLMVLTRIMAKVTYKRLLVGAVAIALANLWLPLDLWPFLTHFNVAYQTILPMAPGDFPTIPLEVENTPNGGQEVVSLKNINESPKSLEQAAASADNSPDALENLLRNYNHRYALVRLVGNGGHISLQTLTPKEALSVDPLPLVTTFFPTIEAYWTVENNQVIQYMAPAASPRVMTQLGTNPGNLVSSLLLMGQQTETAESGNWASALGSYGAVNQSTGLTVQNGVLTGSWNGQSIDVKVVGNRIVGTGSFTGIGLHQVLIEGSNALEVVSLDSQKVVSTYQGDVWNPLSNDMVTGPVDGSGRDVVFVNSSPAQILEPMTGSNWKVLYTAPNPSLRFETSIQDTKSGTPEIITDDPSLMRDSPTRYFSSYTYRNGQLVRNWRVYETNVVNVNPIRFTPGGPQYLVIGIYGSGHILVLKRHFMPVLPVASGILAVVVLAGYSMRLFGKRRQV